MLNHYIVKQLFVNVFVSVQTLEQPQRKLTFSRYPDLHTPKILRDARTTASGKLRRGDGDPGEGQLWAGSYLALKDCAFYRVIRNSFKPIKYCPIRAPATNVTDPELASRGGVVVSGSPNAKIPASSPDSSMRIVKLLTSHLAGGSACR